MRTLRKDMVARILFFDSGLGGLSVARAVRKKVSDADLVFAADNAAFPYGDWEEVALQTRIVDVVGALLARVQPDIVIIACNTASTIALSALREKYDSVFVGTVPAIKPAAERTKSGVVGVLATPGTVKREYTKALIDTYAYHCNVTLHGCANLAEMADGALRGETLNREKLAEEIRPAFVSHKGARTDVVVLGCTHYPLISDQIAKAAPWPVTLIDPSDAIAQHAAQVMPLPNAARATCADCYMTAENAQLERVFQSEGFSDITILP